MFLFGEFNVFRPDDTRLILGKCRAALRPGGTLLLEVSTYNCVRQIGQHPRVWSARATASSPIYRTYICTRVTGTRRAPWRPNATTW